MEYERTTNAAGRRYPKAPVMLVLIGAVAIVVNCSGNCGEDRTPPELPARITNEGQSLLAERTAEQPGDGVVGDGQFEHRQRDELDPNAAMTRSDDRVVARVVDHEIHSADLERRLRRRLVLYRGSGRELTDETESRERERILHEMVEEELLRRFMAEERIVVTNEELEQALTVEIDRIFNSEHHFQRYLDRRGMSREEYSEAKRFEMQLDRLWEARGRAPVTEEQIREYYQSYRANWRAPERVLAATISIRLARSASNEEIAAATEQLHALRLRAVDEGAAFDELAREYSQSPDRYRGGNMGWVYRDDRDLDARVSEILFTLGVGEVSAPVRTLMGLQLFMVRDHRAEGYREFEEVRDSLVDIVEQQSEQALWNALILELESRYEVGYNPIQ